MMIKRLDELVPPQNARIHKIHGFGALRQRMMDMGLVPGAEIYVVRVAPMGDPIEYRIKGYHLSLRGHEAKNILVEVGAVALDKAGNLAAATSTGGMTNKRWGRIGDAPIIGAGTYADAHCGVSATGWGESTFAEIASQAGFGKIARHSSSQRAMTAPPSSCGRRRTRTSPRPRCVRRPTGSPSPAWRRRPARP